MGLIKKSFLVFCIGVVIAFVSGYLGNKYAILGLDDTNYSKNDLQVSVPNKDRITKNTIFEFHYNYNDGLSSTQYTMPPDYMIDFDKGQLQLAYSSWQMESFSPSKVVFIKNFDTESTQHYILKEYKGYVGVFYKKTLTLKELTSTPIASLSEDDAKKYKIGVTIDGDENLVKYLESLET